MPAAKTYDLLVKNVRIVRPGKSSVQKGDIAIADGKFARVGRAFSPRCLCTMKLSRRLYPEHRRHGRGP